MINYQAIGYDDIGRPVALSAYYRTRKAATQAANRIAMSPKITSVTVVKYSGVRRNPETVATATVTPQPSVAAPVAVNPRKRKTKRHIEVIEGKKFYGVHSTGWVVLINGIPEFQGTKAEVTKLLKRL